jgi:hypothetical protein
MSVSFAAIPALSTPKKLFRLSALAVTLSALLGCGDDDVVAPLQYVPADSGYVFANLAPVNAKTVAHLRSVYAPFANDYVKLLDLMEADVRANGEFEAADAEAFAGFKAIIAEMMTFISDEKMQDAGFKVGALTAFYGIGAVPVMRMEHGDPEKLIATIKRLAAKSSLKLQEESYDGGKLFRMGEDKVQPLLFIHKGHLILSMAPNGADAKVLALIAPSKAPGSTAATEKLQALQSKYKLTDDTVGYVESTLLTRIASGQLNALERALLAVSKDPSLPSLDPVCTKEFGDIAANFPRLVFGFNAFEPREMTTRSILEVAPARAKAMRELVPVTPNYGSASVFSFSMSFDPMKSMNFARDQANAILKSPYQCEKLVQLNEDAAKLKESLANPALGMAGMIKGFGVSVEKLSLDMTAERPVPVALEGMVALFTDQPDAVYGMMQAQAKGMLGEIPAQLTAGKAVAISNAQLAPLTQYLPSAKLALVRSDKMLALGIGESVASPLEAAAVAKPGAANLLEYRYGPDIMNLFLSALDSAAKSQGSTDTESTKQIVEISRKAMASFQSLEIAVQLSDNGIEAVQTSRLK